MKTLIQNHSSYWRKPKPLNNIVQPFISIGPKDFEIDELLASNLHSKNFCAYRMDMWLKDKFITLSCNPIAL